jgi:hypothetical protein
MCRTIYQCGSMGRMKMPSVHRGCRIAGDDTVKRSGVREACSDSMWIGESQASGLGGAVQVASVSAALNDRVTHWMPAYLSVIRLRDLLLLDDNT